MCRCGCSLRLHHMGRLVLLAYHCFDVIFVEVTWCIQYTAAWWCYHKCAWQCIYCDCLVTVYGLIAFTALNSSDFPTFSHVLVQLGVSLYSTPIPLHKSYATAGPPVIVRFTPSTLFHDVDKFNSISHVMVASNGHTNIMVSCSQL